MLIFFFFTLNIAFLILKWLFNYIKYNINVCWGARRITFCLETSAKCSPFYLIFINLFFLFPFCSFLISKSILIKYIFIQYVFIPLYHHELPFRTILYYVLGPSSLILKLPIISSLLYPVFFVCQGRILIFWST